MKSFISHYSGVYKEFLTTSLTQAMSFRTSFVLLILMDLFFYASSLASVDFIYDHVNHIGGWSRYQLLFFISYMLTVDTLHMGVLSTNFWVFSQKIKTGELDFDLLKPTHSIFTVFFRFLRPSSFVTLFVCVGTLIYFGQKINLSILQWSLLPILVVLSISLLAILEFILSTSMFWLTEGDGINFFRMQMQQLSRWPDFVYGSLSRKFLSVAIPILLVGSAPVHFLYDWSSWPKIAGMFAAIVVSSFILRWIWSVGLNKYDSASS
jgi:ABC-2 type transport system permease protein